MDKEIAYQVILEKMSILIQKRHADRVYPHELLGWLPFQCSVWTVRRYMHQMSKIGALERVSYRGGYRFPLAA